MIWSKGLLFLLTTVVMIGVITASCQPHILYILADDLAWRDVSWNAEDMYTPNLDRLRREGVELTNHYMHPTCSTSRVAFLTGYYAFRLGIQKNGVDQFFRFRNTSVPPDYTLLPEYLQRQGYNTHLVGKWQVGFCNWDLTPTRRGFDTFYGSYGGNSGHFNHTPVVGGYDFRDDLNVDWSANGSYSTSLYTQRAMDVIKHHHRTQDTRPLFIFLSYEAPHSPLEAPQTYVDSFCSNIEDRDRRVRCGMMAALDEGVGQVVRTMENYDYDSNFLVVFTSDNGGTGRDGASNWPLRGKKRSAYEGGVRVPSFLYSKTLLPDRPYAYHGLMHVTDWLPTLLRVSGARDVDSILPQDRDGYDLWRSILQKEPGVRCKVVLDMDPNDDYGAVRMDQWKLVKDVRKRCLGWLNPPSDTNGGPKRQKCEDFQLFDVIADPNERHDLSEQNPEMLLKLKEFFDESMALVKTLPDHGNDTSSYPDNWGGIWSPGWC